MSIRQRWRRAQDYELGFWKRYADKLTDENGEPLKPKELDFVLGAGLEGKRVLEVGCGPMGVIFFVPGTVRVGIDPLALEYRRHIDFSTRGAHLLASMGEHLPFRDGTFDCVVIGNVLDHVNEPQRTLHEIARVLAPGGQVLMWMHIIPRWMVPARKILDMVDSGHPYHMTEQQAREMVSGARIEPVEAHNTYANLGWRNGIKAALANIAMRNLLIRARSANGVAASTTE
jgi:ubiquinone/menaquinone biosynthesis C-methylase UbiE